MLQRKTFLTYIVANKDPNIRRRGSTVWQYNLNLAQIFTPYNVSGLE